MLTRDDSLAPSARLRLPTLLDLAEAGAAGPSVGDDAIVDDLQVTVPPADQEARLITLLDLVETGLSGPSVGDDAIVDDAVGVEVSVASDAIQPQ